MSSLTSLLLLSVIAVTSPKDGAVVPLLKDAHKAFLDMSRTDRRVNFDDANFRRDLQKRTGGAPLPVEFAWQAEGEAEIRLYRAFDDRLVFSEKTASGKSKAVNLEIARDYYWTLAAEGTVVTNRFKTEDRAPRLLATGDVPNARDLGGRLGLGGRRVRQGRVYRTAGLNDNAWNFGEGKVPGRSRITRANAKVLLDDLGVKTDLDLRSARECFGMSFSPLGTSVNWIQVPSSAYDRMTNTTALAAFRQAFKLFLDEANYPILFHCIGGQDRTGTLAFILNGLLGVSEEELYRDWESTAFWNPDTGWFNHKQRFDTLIALFSTFPGETMNDKIHHYVTRLAGLSAADVALFRDLMLEPTDLRQPLPEHPRPDWRRAEWINLNGEWNFGFAEDRLDRKILVPFGWGSPLSGVKDEGNTGFYRRTVRVPAEWHDKRVFVVVGAADHDTECTFAGRNLGRHVGGYTPFEFELTEDVLWGQEQTLEFKVWDPDPKTAQNGHYLYGKQGYGNARGIWQTVYLEARGPRYVKNARFLPSIARRTVTADITLDAPAESPITAEIALDAMIVPLAFAKGEVRKSVEIPVGPPHLWTLDDPHLYEVALSLKGSAPGGDAVSTYFGFREIGVGKNPNGDPYVTLNGKPIYLQMTLDQSYHPGGWYTFPSDEFMKNEILISKRLALSGNRVHIKVEVPRKLYWADKLGLLIQADVPCAWGDASKEMFAEHWACFADMVARDFNHPSIYQWTLFNETWGLFTNRSLAMGLASGRGGKKRAYERWTQDAVADCYRKAKALDPTRIVEDNSPCNGDHVVTDVNTWHSYRPGYDWERVVRETCATNVVGSADNFVAGKCQNGEPMMNSECGNVWGYRGSTGDCDFTWDYHLMMNAFRRHLKCGGWLYTEHHDVCNEWNGYVRFDRSPKFDGFDELANMKLADLHRDAFIVFYGTPGNETGEFVSPGQKVVLPIGVSLTTDRYLGEKIELTCRHSWHFDGEGRKIWRDLPDAYVAEAKSWQNEQLWNFAFTVPEGAASGCVAFLLKAGDREIAKNFWTYATKSDRPTLSPSAQQWSLGSTNVLDGLKVNGFGRGYFEFELPVDAEAKGDLTFRAELGAKRLNGKDRTAAFQRTGIDYMLGGGTMDRSRNPNSYPQTSIDRHPANIKVYVDGKLVKETVLEDDPADSRGILSWLSQPHEGYLYEAGSYGYLVEAPVAAAAVKDGKVKVRIESDDGLAVYGPAFGRYPFGPHVR